MPEQKDTDLSAAVPPAAPLVGDPADPDQHGTGIDLDPSGDEVDGDDRRRRDEQA